MWIRLQPSLAARRLFAMGAVVAAGARLCGGRFVFGAACLYRRAGKAVLPMITDREMPGGVVHDLPEDLRAALLTEPQALATWHDITPLARNEWICWIESAKKPEPRRKRNGWGCENLRDGKRRPCCWPGCPHR